MSYIMVVDDDPDILQLLKTGLQKTGYEIAAADSADEALKKINERKPDLLITDAMMPAKDGYELAREIRNLPETKSMPIIMLTALQQEQDALKAFTEGVDDFVSKPFSMPILRARISALLMRSQACNIGFVAASESRAEEAITNHRISSGFCNLDSALNGGIPSGSNILVIGDTGAGKSTFARRFISEGLKHREKCMFITLDDDPFLIRQIFKSMLGGESLEKYEESNIFRMVDSYSWNRSMVKSDERFAVSGMMDLNQLAALISDAGMEIGQSVSEKAGGRRVMDSVSSLFINFELILVQRFLAQLSRTASSYGGVTSIFVVEEGSISEREISNIKYLMDVVIELKLDDLHMAKVTNMKWSKFSREWVSIEE